MRRSEQPNSAVALPKQLFELSFPFICSFILAHLDYFEPARRALASSRLQRGERWQDQDSLRSEAFLDTVFYPVLMEDFYTDEQKKRITELEKLLESYKGSYETWVHYQELENLRAEGSKKFEEAFLPRVEPAAGGLQPPLLNDSQRKVLCYVSFANLTSERSNPQPLRALCLVSPEVFQKLFLLLFNPGLEQFYSCKNTAYTDFYLNWLQSLTSQNLDLLRLHLDEQQSGQLNNYLKELEYRKIQRRLGKWLNNYHASIMKEAKSAPPDEYHLYRSASCYVVSLIAILTTTGQDKFKTYEQRVREFFVAYSDKKLILSDPHTKRLKSSLEKLWNWLRKKFGWMPAHRKLERLISTSPHGLFKQERIIYSLLRLVKEYITGFHEDCSVVSYFAELKYVLAQVDKTSEQKLSYFRDFLARFEQRFSQGEFNQEFIAEAKKILGESSIPPVPLRLC